MANIEQILTLKTVDLISRAAVNSNEVERVTKSNHLLSQRRQCVISKVMKYILRR